MIDKQYKAPELRSEVQTEPTRRTNCKGEVLRDTLVALKRAGHKLCILHGYSGFPDRIGSDVDAVSLDPTSIPHILSKYCSTDSVATVQVMQHETSAFYYLLHRRCEGKPVFLALDVCSDYRRDGRTFFRSEELLERSRPFKFFDTLSPELEFAYYLVKKVAKASLDEAQAHRLSQLYGKDPAGCERYLARFFPQEETELIADAARSGEWETVRGRIVSLRRIMLDKSRREHLLRVPRQWPGALRRVIRRILQPTGLAVVFLGADGSGKSTVVERVEQSLAPAFRQTAQYRLRPSQRKGGGVPVTDPHARPLRGPASSLAKLAFWLADYTLGYAIRTFPQLVRSTFVLFDRYYQDLLVDPTRYRYGGPLSLARLLGQIIPRPHLFIVLDAPPEVLYARKQEVSRKEVARQREGYLKLAQSLPNGHVVDASKPLDEVVAGVERIIVNHMVMRTARRLKLDEGR